MSDVELRNHLANHKLNVATRDAIFDHRAVARPHRVPIDTVHVRVVEEVPLHAPGLVKHLPPLRPRIDAIVHSLLRNGLVELLIRLGIDDGHRLALADEHLLAVRRKRV